MSGERSPALPGPLFLVGMPRSGTKLLRDLLNRHPAIAIPEVETEFLPLWAREWPEYGDLSDRGTFLAFHQRVSALPFFTYLEARGEAVDADRWHDACGSFACADVFEALIRTVVGTDASIWGDKSPSYVRHVPLLKTLFPAARVVHIVRDVRDYALSIQQAWGKSMYRAAQRWAFDVQQGVEAVEALGDDGLVIRYEDLVGDSERTMRALCAFIGVDYTERMTTLEKPSENLGRAKGSRAILRDNTSTYRGRLSQRRQRRVEEIAFHTLQSLGYRPELATRPRPLNRPSMLVLKLADGVSLTRAAARERGWLGAIRFHLHFQRFKASGRADQR